MGFPNVDKQLVRILTAGFNAAKADPTFLIEDLFEDLDVAEQAQIAAYLTRKTFVNDVREHKGSNVYVIASFPLLEVPFPQIAISLGAGDSDRFMNDLTGQSKPITDGTGAVVAYAIEKGYYEKSNWDIHTVCATKDEAIWLSRLVQRFICEAFDDLARAGISEVNILIQDLRADENTLQPSTVFNRAIRLSATVANTWNERIPNGTYAEGTNISAG